MSSRSCQPRAVALASHVATHQLPCLLSGLKCSEAYIREKLSNASMGQLLKKASTDEPDRFKLIEGVRPVRYWVAPPLN